tara:strand:- start:10964 stop:11578 length:615 start_codon:yes stop_codon:yes gene_type:complete
MATTGLLLSFFMLFHLFGNLFLFVSPGAFNSYVEKLNYFKPLIRVAEFFLALFVFSHAYTGILLWRKNRKAKQKNESYSKTNTSRAARTASVTGSFVFIFLITHWATFWYKFNFENTESYYHVVVGDEVGFGNSFFSLFYIVAIALLGYHLKHGFLSAGQTLGINGTKYEKFYVAVSSLFWFWVPLGFISIPIWFGFISPAAAP